MSGIGTRLLTISIDSNDYTAECSKAVITSNDAGSDFTTFADAAAGGAREYRLEFTAVQDSAVDSLWDQIWSHAGEDLDCVLAPYGNEVPSAGQPHYTFTATVKDPDGDFLGGEANSSTSARFTVDAVWVLTAKPVKVTA